MEPLLVAITPESPSAKETDRICRLLDGGFDYVHIRKPSWTTDEVRRYLDSIPDRLYSLLTIHDFFEVAVEYGLGGIHLNGRRSTTTPGWTGRVSRSCHTLEEIQELTVEDYAFLSPIFDSISKAGYKSGFSDMQLMQACATAPNRLVALGGMTASRMQTVTNLGFCGCAFLGYLFSPDEDSFQTRLKRIVQQKRITK